MNEVVCVELNTHTQTTHIIRIRDDNLLYQENKINLEALPYKNQVYQMKKPKEFVMSFCLSICILVFLLLLRGSHYPSPIVHISHLILLRMEKGHENE